MEDGEGVLRALDLHPPPHIPPLWGERDMHADPLHSRSDCLGLETRLLIGSLTSPGWVGWFWPCWGWQPLAFVVLPSRRRAAIDGLHSKDLGDASLQVPSWWSSHRIIHTLGFIDRSGLQEFWYIFLGRKKMGCLLTISRSTSEDDAQINWTGGGELSGIGNPRILDGRVLGSRSWV